MPLIFNGTKVKTLNYNGSKVNTIVYNGTSISILQEPVLGDYINMKVEGTFFRNLSTESECYISAYCDYDTTSLIISDNKVYNNCASGMYVQISIVQEEFDQEILSGIGGTGENEIVAYDYFCKVQDDNTEYMIYQGASTKNMQQTTNTVRFYLPENKYVSFFVRTITAPTLIARTLAITRITVVE